jgi:uncharacterized protein
MELTLQRPGDHYFVRSVTADGIQVVDDYYTGPIIISASRLITDWPVKSIEQLGESELEVIFQLAPEIVLIGTGPKQEFLPPGLLMCFYNRSIGIEAMATDAACRTFNVLVSESRNVVAALLPES